MATPAAIRDLGHQMAKWEQDRRQAEITASLGAELNPDNQTPFKDQNEFLANEVKKIGEASAERARLQSEQAREEYDNQVRGNILKQKEFAENRKQEADLVTAQNQQRNFAQAQAIAQQLNSIPIQPGENSYTMDNNKLAQIAKLTQEWNALRDRAPELELMFLDERVFDPGFAPRVPQEQAISPINQKYPDTFEDGRYSHVKQNADGSLEVEWANGARFKANNLDEMAEQLGKSQVHQQRWVREQKELLRQGQQQPGQQPDLGQQYSSISDYWDDQQAERVSNALAKRYGFSNEQEMVNHFQNLSQTGQMIEEKALALDFSAKHPEFPNTTAASDALTGIIAANGWQWNLNSMEAANALAIQRGLYQPLTQDQIAYANGTPVQQTRPTPPPLVHGSNPESSFNQRTIEEMHWATKPNGQFEYSLADLRKEIIRQQLGGQ